MNINKLGYAGGGGGGKCPPLPHRADAYEGHESEGQYEAPSLNNPNASGSHKQQELVQPTPVITRSGRVSKPPNRL